MNDYTHLYIINILNEAQCSPSYVSGGAGPHFNIVCLVEHDVAGAGGADELPPLAWEPTFILEVGYSVCIITIVVRLPHKELGCVEDVEQRVAISDVGFGKITCKCRRVCHSTHGEPLGRAGISDADVAVSINY